MRLFFGMKKLTKVKNEERKKAHERFYAIGEAKNRRTEWVFFSPEIAIILNKNT